MATEGPGHEPDVDEEFARIVAGWDDVAPTSGSAHLPPAEGMPDSRDSGSEGDAAGTETTAPVERTSSPARDLGVPEPPGEVESRPATEPKPEPPTDDPAYPQQRHVWRAYPPEDDTDEHFEPPEPQLPPAHDATYWLAVVGMVAGPLLVLWAVVFSGNPDPGWLIVAGLLLLGFGFGLLIMRGSGERDPDDDGSRL